MDTNPVARPSYDDDFHAWAIDQATRLRALAQTRPNEPVDWELIAEEIESMGASDRRACESYLEHIITPLLEIELAQDAQPIRHWRREVAGFRKNLRKRVSPSLLAQLPSELGVRYRDAVTDAIGAMEDGDPAFYERVPRQCPYTWEQIAGDWLPERAIA